MCCQSLQSCPALCNPMDCSPREPMGILQARMNTGMGCHALLQGIFLTQGSNQCLLWLQHCRWILYPLSHGGSFIQRCRHQQRKPQGRKKRRALLGRPSTEERKCFKKRAGDDIVCHWRKSKVKTEKWWFGIKEKIGKHGISDLSDDLSQVFPFSGGTKNQTVVDGDLTRGEDAETISRLMALKTSRGTVKWLESDEWSREDIYFLHKWIFVYRWAWHSS